MRQKSLRRVMLIVLPLTLALFPFVTVGQGMGYVYDSLNRLIEIHYSDRVLHYAYDDAGNRTGMTVEIVTAAPLITALSPRGVLVGSSGLTLTISGSGYTNSSVVRWNGEDRTTTFISANEVRINLTPADLASVGTASVVVVNPTPSILVSNGQTFSIVQAPAFAGRVTLNGAGLANVAINLTGSEAASTQSDGNGNFSFLILNSGSYILTPNLSGYAFSPPGLSVGFTGISQSNLDFAATWVGYSISGTVTYGNAVSGPPAPRYVSHVLISGSGSPPVSVFTGGSGSGAGTYSLTGLGTGTYTVTPTKTGGVNNITSFDAAKIAQHVAGVSLLTGNQLVVADVTGNGQIQSFDAARIAQYVASITQTSQTGTWKFTPGNRTHASITSDITGEDYTALLMGEVSGNWTNTGARPANNGGPERSTAVTLPHLVAPADGQIVVPVAVQGAADKGIIAYEFNLRYDPAVIQPQTAPVDLIGTASKGLLAVANAEEPGLLRVVVYGATPIDGNGVLLNLRFKAVGGSGSISPLTLERMMLNEGEPGIVITNGSVELAAGGAKAPNS